MTIIKSIAGIKAASDADLVQTYNSLAGKDISTFATRGVAELQVERAFLASDKEAAKMAKETEKAERKARNATPKAKKVVAAVAKGGTAAKAKRTAAGKKGAKTVKAAKVAKVKAERKARAAGKAVGVRLLGDIHVKRHGDSMRTKVFNAIVALDEKLKADGVRPVKRVLTYDAITKKVGFDCRSFVHKLGGTRTNEGEDRAPDVEVVRETETEAAAA